MGHIRTKPQVDQQGQETGNTLLEITYGGKESPFGGLDYSAPPAYIDPNSFADADGFLVVDNKLFAASFQTANIPTLWNGTAGVKLLKFGNFYNSLTGLLNYALGYIATPIVGPPTGVAYTFYITAWNPLNVSTFYNDTLSITLYDAESVAQQATLTLDALPTYVQSTSAVGSGGSCSITALTSSGPNGVQSVTVSGGSGYVVGDVLQLIQGSSNSCYLKVTAVGGGGSLSTVSVLDPGYGYSIGAGTFTGTVEYFSGCNLVINGPKGGPTTYAIPSWATGFTRQQLVTDMVAQINSAPDPNVTASASLDGYSLVLTANFVGASGNSITVQDTSYNATPGLPPPFYFSCTTPRNLQNGQAQASNTAPRSFDYPASATAVGGTLYFANLGPMILKYSGPGLFTTSSLYQGVGTIKKFGGSLIGLRVSPQLGTFTQNQDMIIAWTAADDLDEWSPLSNTGNVTGAGFAQLADIGDYLTGLIVCNNTAFIIRAQGVSYALALGSGTNPFQLAHVALGDEGEGAQISALVCQYDQMGAYIGNSDIYQASGTLSPIGGKVKSAIFTQLAQVGNFFVSATACAIALGGDVSPYIVFQIAGSIYIYSVGNQMWMRFNGPWAVIESIATILGVLSQRNNFATSTLFDQTLLALAYQPADTFGAPLAPQIYSLVESIPNSNAIDTTTQVTFPQEELLLGRDVTIDALYVSMWANIQSTSVSIQFWISGVLFASRFLTPADWNTLSGDPIEIQVFPNIGSGSGAFTVHSPQLQIVVLPTSDTDINQIRFSKIQMYGSFDPSQRPV